MKRKIFFTLFFASTNFIIAQTKADKEIITSSYNVEFLKKKQLEVQAKYSKQKEEAINFAKSNNLPISFIDSKGNYNEIMRVTDGYPIYYATDNADGRRISRVNHLQTSGSLGINVNGENMIVNVWDGGPVRATHNLLNNRVTPIDVSYDGTNADNHATHVTGTIIGGSGLSKGMAPAATARTFTFDNDMPEMINEAFTQGILISNHSYGIPLINATTGVQYPASGVGAYGDDAIELDNLLYNTPYYLSVHSAGNSGTQENSGAIAQGYDKLIGDKVAKNNLVVGNIQKITTSDLPSSTGIVNGSNKILINLSSSQGPTDDLRIKPDVCAVGTDITSAGNGSNTAVATLTGTSMSSPNVAGTLLLLQQYYKVKTNGFMKAATLKALACHTADDAGNPGPDPIYGWGLVNAKFAAETIRDNGLNSWISEEILNNSQTYTYTAVAEGGKPLIATVCWTDLAGPPTFNSGSNQTSSRLINDLDVRITNSGTINYPWSLTNIPSNNAVRNVDNNKDTVEGIKIDNPTANGVYTITVTHKGNLVNGSQPFSIILTGVKSSFSITPTSNNVNTVCNNANANFTFAYNQTTGSTGVTNLSVTGLPSGAVATFNSATISANGNISLTVSNLSNVPAGEYILGITGTKGSETETRYRTLKVLNTALTPVNKIFPANNQNDLSTITEFKWDRNYSDEKFTLQIATDNAFTNLIANISDISTNSYIINSGLNVSTQYYWRVIPYNRCVTQNQYTNEAIISTFSTGTVVDLNTTFAATDFSNALIANTAGATARVPIPVSGNFKIADLDVELDLSHSYVADIQVWIESPTSLGSKTSYLLKNNCGQYNNILATFDEQSSVLNCPTVDPSPQPAISGNIKPIDNFSIHNNQIADGTWYLNVLDPNNEDGGTVNSVKLIFAKLQDSALSSSNFEVSNLINLYPNPVKDILKINKSQEIDIDSFKVIDIQGRVVISNKFQSEINTVNLNSGIYIIEFRSNNNKIIKKFIKM
jgi:subtilisin-like proprotein convertase family protein